MSVQTRKVIVIGVTAFVAAVIVEMYVKPGVGGTLASKLRVK